MSKNEFLTELKSKLLKLPEKELLERVNFYSEMIDDLVEDGATEEEAVLKVGSVDEIASQILTDYLAEETTNQTQIKINKRKLSWWQITLIVVGSPIAFAIVASIFAVGVSLFASLIAVIVSFWAASVSFAVCAVGGVIMSIVYAVIGDGILLVALLSGGLICAGLAILSYYGNLALTKCFVIAMKKFPKWLKKVFIKKEVA